MSRCKKNKETGNNIEETRTIWWKETWEKKGGWIIKLMTVFKSTEGLSSGEGSYMQNTLQDNISQII